MRRQRGTGSIENVGGRFRFRCPNGHGGRYCSPLEYENEADAVRGLNAYRRQILRGELTPVGGLTLTQYVEDTWLPRIEREKPRSVKTYRSNWVSQISKAKFAPLPLAVIRRRDVKAWVFGMEIEHPEHPAAVLKTILASAVDDELISVNVAAGLRMQRRRRVDTCPTPEEEVAILTCPGIPRERRLILAFVSDTALRVGEWRNLRQTDLHLNDPQPWVMVMRGADDSDTTKSKKSRPVPLLPLAFGAVQEWLRLLKERGTPNPLGLVFPRPDGKRFRKSHTFGSVDREDQWHVYRRIAGVTREIRLYDFRHRGATKQLAGEGGRPWSMREVQELLGHSSHQTTEKFYIHTNQTLAMRAAREMSSGQNRPDPIAEALEIRTQAPVSQLSPSSSPIGAEAPDSSLYAENGPAWPDVGLLVRLASGTQEDAIRAIAPFIAERRATDPVERAFSRLQTEHWKAGLSELISLLPRHATASKKGGTR